MWQYFWPHTVDVILRPHSKVREYGRRSIEVNHNVQPSEKNFFKRGYGV